MGCEGHAERQAEEYEHRQLQQAGAAAGKRRKQVGQQGGKKKYELFQDSAANYWRGVIIMANRLPYARVNLCD